METFIQSIKIFNDDIPNEKNFRYMRFVSLVYITILMAATVCAYKIVAIGKILEPGSTLIYTFSFFWGNVLAEVYGAKLARRLVWETLICGYLFALLITIIGLLPSPEIYNNGDAFGKILGHTLRFTTAGEIGFLISSFLNIYIITKWKYKMHGKLFWLRSFVASTVSEAAATFIAGLITFFHLMSTTGILSLMTNALIFKILYGLIAVWPASFFAFFLKKLEENKEQSNATLVIQQNEV